MAGIPQALTQLTEYLNRENSVLEAKNKEKQLSESIGEIANSFKELGPDASVEDAQSLLFSSISEATKEGNLNAIPVIGGLFDTFMQGLTFSNQEEDRKKKQETDKLVAEQLHKDTGVPLIPGSPEAELQLLEARRLSTQNVNTEDSSGRTRLSTFRIDYSGNRTEIGSTEISGVGFDEKFKNFQREEDYKQKLDLQKIRVTAANNQTKFSGTSYVTKSGQEIIEQNGLKYVSFVNPTNGKTEFKKWTPDMGIQTIGLYGRQSYNDIQTNKSIVKTIGPAAGNDALALATLLKVSDGLTPEQKREMFNSVDKNKPISVVSTISSLNESISYTEDGIMRTKSDGSPMTQLEYAISKIEDEDSRVRAENLAKESLWKISQYNEALNGLVEANDPETKKLSEVEVDPSEWESIKGVLADVWKSDPSLFNKTFNWGSRGPNRIVFDTEESVTDFLDGMYRHDPEGLKSIYEYLKKSKVE